MRQLWTGDAAQAHALHESVAALAVRLPRERLPIWVLHGDEDGLLPTDFTSEPYVSWLQEAGRTPRYWKVPHAQHFDAFLALPGFGDRYVPLLPYGYAALDRTLDELIGKATLAPLPTPQPRPRGAGALRAAMLDLAP